MPVFSFLEPMERLELLELTPSENVLTEAQRLNL
jgi:hypothetical protein